MMAHECSPTGGPGEHASSTPFFHPDEDADLLRSITLYPDAITPDWVECFNHHLETGFVPMPSDVVVSVSVRQKIITAREAALAMIGLQEPTHPLHNAFLSTHKEGKLIPPHLFSTLKALTPFGDPVTMLQGTYRLWGVSDKNIRRRVDYMGRMARLLGWRGEQPDAPAEEKTPEELVHELVCEHPELLLYDRKKLGVFARIATEFGEARHRQWPQMEIVKFITWRKVEPHVLGVAYRDDYELGLRSGGQRSGKKHQYGSGLRQEIQVAVADPTFVDKVGRPVLRAYFRANPPSPKARAEFPLLQQFLSRGGCRGGTGLGKIHILELPALVTGEEPWLKEMKALPSSPPAKRTRRKQALDTLNWHAVLGSRPLHGGTAELVSPAYRLVARHRTAFFAMLGWTKPDHPLYNRLKTLQGQRRNALIPPRRIVQVLNALSSRGVDPIVPVLESNFQILESGPESLHRKLDMYEDFGFAVNERLQQTAWPLRMGVDALAAYLAREAERTRSQRSRLVFQRRLI